MTKKANYTENPQTKKKNYNAQKTNKSIKVNQIP